MSALAGLFEEEEEKEEDKDKEKPCGCEEYDPCKCAPGRDKEIIFNRDTCLSTDPRILWDYHQGLLTIDGRLATSGYISSGSQVEGAYFAPQALGLGAFDFTPPSGYGGIAYRGGSVFYYWNDHYLEWEPIDLGAEDVIDVAHNGTVIGTRGTINFVDSASVTWTLTSNGSVNISASDGSEGPWQEDQNANGHSIYNLTSINGIPMSNFLTHLWDATVNANFNDLINVNNLGAANVNVANNLTVGGEIYYQGKTLQQYIQDAIGEVGSELWTENADGSISRNSNVYINGAYDFLTKHGPLSIGSSNNTNFLFLNNAGGGGAWSAFAAEANGVYSGELGFSPHTVELWSNDYLVFRGYDANNVCMPGTGYVYFQGRMGVGILCPQFFVDVVSSDTYVMRVDSTGNFSGLIIDHNNDQGGGQSLISFRKAGRETAVISYDDDEDAMILWTGDQDAALSTLCCSTNSFVGIRTTDPAYPLDVNGDCNIASGSIYRIGGIPLVAPPNRSIQFNNSNTFGGSDGLIYDTNGYLRLTGMNQYSNSTIIEFCGRVANNELLWYLGTDPYNTGGKDWFIGASGLGPILQIQRSTGYVGLADSNPNYRLTVGGDINIVDAGQGSVYRLNGVPGIWLSVSVANASGIGGTQLIFNGGILVGYSNV